VEGPEKAWSNSNKNNNIYHLHYYSILTPLKIMEQQEIHLLQAICHVRTSSTSERGVLVTAVRVKGEAVVGNGSSARNTITGTPRFFERDGSLWARVTGSRGTVREVRVSDAFKVVGLGQAIVSKSWCVVVTFDDPDGFEQKVAIWFDQLVSDRRKAIAILAHRGLMVSPARLGRDLFVEYLHSAKRSVETRIAVRMVANGTTVFVGTFDPQGNHREK
jgi:hypothetical protein